MLLCAITLANLPFISLAAGDQFTIEQTIIDSPDTESPTVPMNLLATAVSTSQINLSWTASTDNAAVSGYQVFRDGGFIATSTATNFSDTGLSPSTLYTYTVTAFDYSVNISAESAPASATTFSVTPPSAPPGVSSRTGGQILTLKYLSVSPDLQSAFVRFGTYLAVRTVVSWGKTVDYELGSSASSLYRTDHSIYIDSLTPSTRYYFKIELIDGYGRYLSIGGQEFTTLSLPDVIPPANVTNFTATPSEKDITLTWNNPVADFQTVRIVKSDKFYPNDPLNGEIVYEGRAERFVDTEVMIDKRYYYTAFSRDRIGNYSSGAVTDAVLVRPGEMPKSPKLFAGILELSKELVPSLLRNLSILDIGFFQDGMQLPVHDKQVEIRGDRNLTVSIKYEKVPEILKTIVVTMFDPTDKNKTFSFLLRVNADKTAYEAHISALGRPGKYEFSFAILDHKHQGLALLAGTIISQIPEIVLNGKSNTFGVQGISYLDIFWSILALTLIVLGLFLTLKKRRKDQIYARSQGIPFARNSQ